MDFNQSGVFVLIVLDSELREEYINLCTGVLESSISRVIYVDM